MKRNDRAARALIIGFFLVMLAFAGITVGIAVRFAYIRYTGDFGSGSLSGLSELSTPILVLILGAPLLAFLFASLVTFRALRRAKKKEDAERENDPDGEERNSVF